MRILFVFLLFCQGLFAAPDFSAHIKVEKGGVNKIGYLEIEREHPIDQSTYLYVKFALEHFKSEKVHFVVLNLDTPGGEVFAATKIAQLLVKIDKEDHIPVVAFVDNWALSAGALLAYSCRYIGITETASMGAAEPITAGSDGSMETAPEKINSALRAEFENYASIYGRDPLIAEAMVDKEILLVERSGRMHKLQADEQPLATDTIISARGKLLTLNAKELMEFHVADFESNSLFAEPFFAEIPEQVILPYEDWKIDFFSFLSHPAVSSLLFMGLILGIYLEISHPGFGVPGVLAVCCLSLILLSSFAVQAINWLEIIILFLGVLFLLLEIFVIPGFGVVGILGILMTLGGLFALMLPSLEGVDFSFTHWSLGLDIVLSRLAWFIGALLLSLIVIAWLMRSLPKRPFIMKRFIHGEDQEGFVPFELDRSFIGKQAIAATDLKPSGHITVEGTTFQAVSQSGYLAKGSTVIITAAEGAHYVVKEL